MSIKSTKSKKQMSDKEYEMCYYMMRPDEFSMEYPYDVLFTKDTIYFLHGNDYKIQLCQFISRGTRVLKTVKTIKELENFLF